MRHIYDEFVAALKKLGMPAGEDNGFTVHRLRRFFKSFCISDGVSREYADPRQRHSSIKSASDRYVHTFDAESQRLIKNVPLRGPHPAADAGRFGGYSMNITELTTWLVGGVFAVGRSCADGSLH